MFLSMAMGFSCGASLLSHQHSLPSGLSLSLSRWTNPIFLYKKKKNAIFFNLSTHLLSGNGGKNHQFRRKIQTLVEESGIPSISFSSPPYESLRRGNWVKLICGASFEVQFLQILNLPF